MQNKKTNWWVIIAILVIGIPVGYVSTGVIKNMANKDEIAVVDSVKDVKIESMNTADSIKKEKEDTVANEPVPEPVSDVAQEKDSKEVKDKQQEIVRPKPSVDEEEKTPSPKPTPKKLYASVKPNSLAYAVNGGSKTINISSNTNWRITIVEGDNWLRANTTNGNGNKAITFVAKESKVTSQRNATIEVKWTDENDDERTCQIKASQTAYVPAPEPVTVSEVQSIVASGRVDSRIPDNCKVEGNGVNTTYRQFRKNVAERSYESVKVESVVPDKKGNASRLKVKVVRPTITEPVKNVTKTDKPEPAPIKSNSVLSKDEAQAIVSSGKVSSKISEGCKIVLNGKTTNYQNFRNGVKLGSYSGIKVTKVEDDGKTVNAVYVTAKVKSGDD